MMMMMMMMMKTMLDSIKRVKKLMSSTTIQPKMIIMKKIQSIMKKDKNTTRDHKKQKIVRKHSKQFFGIIV
jgi:flagellin-specific chaperone FliS